MQLLGLQGQGIVFAISNCKIISISYSSIFMAFISTGKPWIKKVARVGLISKGLIYAILGLLAFMAAFEIGGQSNSNTSKTGVFNSIKDFPAGLPILVLLTAGLICYSLWRGIQTFSNSNKSEIKWTKRVRYFFSGITYLSLAGSAIQMIFWDRDTKGDKNQYWVSQILDTSFGEWLIGLGAFILAGVGIYQIYYGLSEKYRSHVEQLNLHSRGSSLLLRSGKIGYLSRGIVWLVIGYLFFRSAFHNNSSEAGDTGKAFDFIESSSFGSYLLAALGVGLIAYGIFNFIRARYETFK